MRFGPYNLLADQLKFQDLYLDITADVSQLWGANGAGKSTVLIMIVEQLIKQKTSFAYIDQDYRKSWLWWKNVSQNLELRWKLAGNKTRFIHSDLYESEKYWLESLLSKSNIALNFATENEFKTVNLSGGQLQRVMLLRELMSDPKYVILDEAFSALDKKVALEILEWLLVRQKQSGFRIISVSHDPEIVRKMGGEIFYLVKDVNGQLSLNPANINQLLSS